MQVEFRVVKNSYANMAAARRGTPARTFNQALLLINIGRDNLAARCLRKNNLLEREIDLLKKEDVESDSDQACIYSYELTKLWVKTIGLGIPEMEDPDVEDPNGVIR